MPRNQNSLARLDVRFRGELHKVRLSKDDVLILKVDGVISHETASRLHDEVKRRFPNNEILVMGRDLSLEVHAARPIAA